MRKRLLLAALATLPFIGSSRAEGKSGKYTVPDNVKKIRVRSYFGDKEVLDTNFRVKPGQVFVIDAIEED